MREYSLFRHMGSEYLARALSEDNKRFRQKNLSVNIKIACFTWLLEFSVGVSVIIFWLLAGKHHQNLLRLINSIIIFIILPLAYILNREVTKQIIVMENWLAGVRSIFMSKEMRNQEVERLEQNYNSN